MRARSLERGSPEAPAAPFVVYVEGALDRGVLAAWARRLSPRLPAAFEAACVILGGRQPARAAEDLARRRMAAGDARGLCILDGDLPAAPAPPEAAGEGLEVFTWRRRHIESYLLVPAAIERAARADDTRLRRLLEDELPPPRDEGAWLSFDAKRFLGPKGPLARQLGRTLAAGWIARAMRAEEIHEEVRALCARLAAGLGVLEPEVAVSLRAPLATPADEV
jgi:hypothetical protein